ncbi:MAG: YicC family protein [Planctomycetales bacterium]|nr:YicC family protein [Planctomycetales bacterium]
MTGQGQGRAQRGNHEVSAEVRAVNNRHLKIQSRTGEGLGSLEPQMEALIRGLVRRGSLQLSVQRIGASPGSDYLLQEQVLESYMRQCKAFAERVGMQSGVSLGSLLTLPGVVVEPRESLIGEDTDPDLATCALQAVGKAIECLNNMRRAEGASMQQELTRQVEQLHELSNLIEARAPQVIEDYRNRLTNRLSSIMSELAKVAEADFSREILLMADKADIREELVRLRSHFDQFSKLLDADVSHGRKLDFLIQEMFRETNTIGSKANDAEISQRVVDMKTIIEQMRELVQNVE